MYLVLAFAPRMASAYIPDGAHSWHYSNLYYRREIEVLSDSAHTRTNVPVWVNLAALGTVDLATIKVDEVTNSTPVAISAAAYAQPSGRDPRLFWVAPGITEASQTRRFLIYFNKVSAAPAYPFSWNRTGSAFGTYSVVPTGTMTAGTRFAYTLLGDRIELMRTGRDPASGLNPNHAFFYERNSDYTTCKDLKSGYEPMGGFKADYSFYSQYPDVVGMSEVFFDQVLWDRNGPTAAFMARYSMTKPIGHKTEMTHRVFQGQPILEFSLTATPNSGSPLEFSRDSFNARRFYWDNNRYNYTRMLTDLGYDGKVTEDGKSKNWIILCDSSGWGFGIFTYHPGCKRVKDGALQDYENLASDKGSVYVYLGVAKKDELKLLFDTMKRGISIGVEQFQKFTIMEPDEDRHFIPGEKIQPIVAGSGLGSDTNLRVDYPDGSYKNLRPASISNNITFDLGTVTATTKFGTWKLTASSGGTSRIRRFVVNNPDHPRLIFTATELKTMQARWKADPGYQRVRSRLINKADSALADPRPPTELDDDDGPRFYARNVMSLASILLLDPAVPHNYSYRSRMWADWRTMMGWKKFNPIKNNISYMEGDDVERGEALQELATVYDWFCKTDLSEYDQRKYADRFADFADALLDSDYANISWPRWDTYNQIANNRGILQCSALAGLERLLVPELPSARRTPWRNREDLLWNNLTTMALCPDGSWNEGESYHALSLLGLMFWAEVTRLNKGSSSFYSTVPWFREMPNYLIYGMLPGRVGNFGGMLPFGNTDPEPYYSVQAVAGVPGMRGSQAAQWVSENIDYERVESYQSVWQDLSKTAIDRGALPNWHMFSRRGIFVYRNNWNDDAFYFATKCGEYWGGHEHPDAGTFVIHRAGFPYIAAPHYVAKTMPEDENILMANGKTIRGRGDDAYSEPVEPAYWGKTLRALGSPDAFIVLQNPTPAYEAGSNLRSYTREFVGVGDSILMRDVVWASGASTLRLMQHGYQTDPQTATDSAYDPNQYPSSYVFLNQAAPNKIRCYPNRGQLPAENMTIYDLSRYKWSTTITPWLMAPADIPGYIQPGTERRGNANSTVFGRGTQLTRTISGVTWATALQVFTFRNDTMNWRAWSSSVSDEGALMVSASNMADVRCKIVWPRGGRMSNVTGSEGLSMIGVMALRNYENRDFGGRDLTYLRDDSALGERTTLMTAPVPVTLISKTAGGLGEAWIACDQTVSVTLYCPMNVYKAYFNGKSITFSSAGSLKTFVIPATPEGGALTLNQAYKPTSPAAGWEGYE